MSLVDFVQFAHDTVSLPVVYMQFIMVCTFRTNGLMRFPLPYSRHIGRLGFPPDFADTLPALKALIFSKLTG